MASLKEEILKDHKGFVKHLYISNKPLRIWWALEVLDEEICSASFFFFLDSLSFEDTLTLLSVKIGLNKKYSNTEIQPINGEF